VARDEGRRLSARQVDVKSDQAGNVPRHNVVKVGYGVVAAAAVDEVAAHTGLDIVIASAGRDDVVSAITVDEIGGTVGPEERFGFAGSFDNSHGRAPSWLEPRHARSTLGQCSGPLPLGYTGRVCASW